jgi:hypothetical protein
VDDIAENSEGREPFRPDPSDLLPISVRSLESPDWDPGRYQKRDGVGQVLSDRAGER